jgi:hypothetical protein
MRVASDSPLTWVEKGPSSFGCLCIIHTLCVALKTYLSESKILQKQELRILLRAVIREVSRRVSQNYKMQFFFSFFLFCFLAFFPFTTLPTQSLMPAHTLL